MVMATQDYWTRWVALAPALFMGIDRDIRSVLLSAGFKPISLPSAEIARESALYL